MNGAFRATESPGGMTRRVIVVRAVVLVPKDTNPLHDAKDQSRRDLLCLSASSGLSYVCRGMNDSAPSPFRSGPSTRDMRFAPTRWTIVLKLREQQENSRETTGALDFLCHTYWYPLYAFARKQGNSAHDAQDLTQGFFSYLLEKDLFAAADRNLGKLRTFLLTAFTRYITRERVHAAAQKRGGGRRLESLDEEFDDGERRYRLEPADKVTPEQIYARSWALSLLKAAKEGVAKKETRAGRGDAFKVLEPFLEQDRDQSVTYDAVARRLSMSQEAVRKAVSRLRERYRDAVRDEIANTLRDPSDKEIDTEMRSLWAALS
jgi:RNA polymerase sigma-70 factor (ECF subfamily)